MLPAWPAQLVQGACHLSMLALGMACVLTILAHQGTLSDFTWRQGLGRGM